jgi:hypothetical protein
MALLATKSNEDARSSGAGAPARGPAPSPVHRPKAGRFPVFNGAVVRPAVETQDAVMVAASQWHTRFSK